MGHAGIEQKQLHKTRVRAQVPSAQLNAVPEMGALLETAERTAGRCDPITAAEIGHTGDRIVLGRLNCTSAVSAWLIPLFARFIHHNAAQATFASRSAGPNNVTAEHHMDLARDHYQSGRLPEALRQWGCVLYNTRDAFPAKSSLRALLMHRCRQSLVAGWVRLWRPQACMAAAIVAAAPLPCRAPCGQRRCAAVSPSACTVAQHAHCSCYAP